MAKPLLFINFAGMLSISLHPFPVLNTNRLHLRSVKEGDAPEFYWLRNSKEVMKYIELPGFPTLEYAKSRILSLNESRLQNEGISWAITLKENSEVLIGWILYKSIDLMNHRAEVGYLLHPDYWRKGIVQEALQAVLDFGFNTLNFHSLEAFVNPENEASINLLEKFGFVKEAHFRENFYSEGQFLDTGVYCLLKSDYKAR